MNKQEQERLYAAPGEGHVYTIGHTFTTAFKVPVEATESQVAVVELTLTPGAMGAPVHKHTYEDEISYVLEGELTLLIGDEVITASRAPTWLSRAASSIHSGTVAWKPRLVEIIASGHFASYFPELALRPDGRPAEHGRIEALRERYGLVYDMERTSRSERTVRCEDG
jgi:hypothetical protein